MRAASARSVAASLLAFGFAICEAKGAFAAPISISPIGVTLAPPARVAQFTIKNPSEEPLRLQISAYAWTDTPEGKIQLTPTHDVIVFPQLVTIPLFGAQAVRAALLSPPNAVEKTYRVVIDIIPPAPTAAERLSEYGAILNVRTRVTVPIFDEPMVPKLAGQITRAAAKRATLTFAIRNLGNAHLGEDEIRIIGRDSGGQVVFSEPFRGWTVLVGSQRQFSFQMPQARCRDVRTVTLAPARSTNVPVTTISVESGVCHG